ncbi:MAG: hypothetical protein ABIJ15_09485 [bacterium]
MIKTVAIFFDMLRAMAEKQSLFEKILKSKPVRIGAAVLLLSNFAFASDSIYKNLLKKADTAEEIEFIESCREFDKLTKREYADYPDMVKAKQEKLREAAEIALKDLARAEQIYREGELIKVPTIFEMILNQEIPSVLDTREIKRRRTFVKLCEKMHYLFGEKACREPKNLEYEKQMVELEEAAIEGLYVKDWEVGRKRYLEIVFPKYSESLLVFEDAKKTVTGDRKKVKRVDECKVGYYSAMEKYFAHPDISGLQIKFYLEAARLAPSNFEEVEEKKEIADRLNKQNIFDVFKNLPGEKGDYIERALKDYKKAMLSGKKESNVILEAIILAMTNIGEAEKFYMPEGYGK